MTSYRALRRIRDRPSRSQAGLACLTVMAILVSRAPTRGKDIPVYFQGVRTILQSWLPLFRRFGARQIGLRHDVTSGTPAANFEGGGDGSCPRSMTTISRRRKSRTSSGQDLSLLSAGELTERIALLKDEIGRLEADMAKKQARQISGRRFFQKMNSFNVVNGSQRRPMLASNLEKDLLNYCDSLTFH